MLEQLVTKYAEVQAQAKALEEQLKEMKTKILEEMNTDNISKVVTENGVSAQITTKETFKYTDEALMIAWCEKNGHKNLVKKSIVTTEMNKELKKGMSLTEALKPLYISNISYSLTVK